MRIAPIWCRNQNMGGISLCVCASQRKMTENFWGRVIISRNAGKPRHSLWKYHFVQTTSTERGHLCNMSSIYLDKVPTHSLKLKLRKLRNAKYDSCGPDSWLRWGTPTFLDQAVTAKRRHFWSSSLPSSSLYHQWFSSQEAHGNVLHRPIHFRSGYGLHPIES